jgi:hypothetical protein
MCSSQNRFVNSYETLRRLIDNAIGSADIQDRRIGVIDGCGHDGIVTAASADDLLMHAADIIISNHDSCGECWGGSSHEIDELIEQAGEHVASHGLGRLSDGTWELVRKILRSMAIWFAVEHDPAPLKPEPEGEMLTVSTAVPEHLAGTVDLIERNADDTVTVWFTEAGTAVRCTDAVTLHFRADSYVGEITRNGVERYYEFAPGSPKDGAIGVKWAAGNPGAAAIEVAEWAARIEAEEMEAA